MISRSYQSYANHNKKINRIHTGTFVKLISKRFQENRDKYYSASEFFDIVRSHREKQEEEEEKRFQQSIAKIIVRSAQSLKGSMLEHSSAVLVQRRITTIQSKASLARERNQKKPRRQHLKKLQRLVSESLSSCCEELRKQDELFGGSGVKRDVEMRVKFDEELTFDPCLEFRVRSTFSGLYKEEAEPKLLEFMKECLTKCADRLVEISAKEKKEKKKKKSLPYVVATVCEQRERQHKKKNTNTDTDPRNLLKS